MTWQNPIDTAAGRPYREVPTLEHLSILGMYFRLLTPSGSRVESVSGGSFVKLTAPASVAEEAGRTVIGTYLMVPPGTTTLRYVWTSPASPTPTRRGGVYRLTIQKQPGLLPGPLTVRIRSRTGSGSRPRAMELTCRRRHGNPGPPASPRTSRSASDTRRPVPLRRNFIGSSRLYRPVYSGDHRDRGQPVDFRRQLGVLRAWSWLFVASLLLAGGAAYLVSINLPKVYEGTPP